VSTHRINNLEKGRAKKVRPDEVIVLHYALEHPKEWFEEKTLGWTAAAWLPVDGPTGQNYIRGWGDRHDFGYTDAGVLYPTREEARKWDLQWARTLYQAGQPMISKRQPSKSYHRVWVKGPAEAVAELLEIYPDGVPIGTAEVDF